MIMVLLVLAGCRPGVEPDPHSAAMVKVCSEIRSYDSRGQLLSHEAETVIKIDATKPGTTAALGKAIDRYYGAKSDAERAAGRKAVLLECEGTP